MVLEAIINIEKQFKLIHGDFRNLFWQKVLHFHKFTQGAAAVKSGCFGPCLIIKDESNAFDRHGKPQ